LIEPPLDRAGQEHVRSVIRANVQRIASCYGRGGCPSVVTRFKISRSGATLVLEATDLRTPSAEACVKGVFGSMRFPELHADAEPLVTYPFRPTCAGE
jgi:hypothetical protein